MQRPIQWTIDKGLVIFIHLALYPFKKERDRIGVRRTRRR